MSLTKFYNWEEFDINWDEEGYHWQEAVFIKVTATITVNNVTITQVVEDDVDSHTVARNFVFIIDDEGIVTSPTPPEVLNVVINASTSNSNIQLTVRNIEFVNEK